MALNSIATHWMFWYDGVEYHSKYITHYAEYLKCEMELSNQPPAFVEELHALFQNDQKVEELRLQLWLIAA